MVLQLACGDDGTAETTQTPTTLQPTVSTAPMTDTGNETTATGAATSEPTGGSDSLTGNGPGTNNTTTTDPTTGGTTNGLTSTDPTLTTGGPGTLSDTTADTSGDTSTSTDPGGTSTGTDPSTTTSDDTTTTSDDTTTSGEETADIPCNVVEATLTPIAPNIMLVLDKSGSMLIKWNHDADANTPTITRWQSLHTVVSAVVNGFDNQINFGANLFPAKTATELYDATACTVQGNVEVKVKFNNGTPIINTIPPANTTTIKGGTPSSAGMTAALTHLKTLDAAIPRAVLFITDGAANCGMGLNPPPLFEQYDQTLHTIVDNAFKTDKIPTYVVGIDIANAVTPVMQEGNPDGINPYEKLNDVALKGGKPKNNPTEKFYNANNQIELDAALATIISDTISCEIKLAEEPAKPELTEVKISGVEIPFVNNCNGNGWTWVNPNGPYDALVLCGTACTQLKQVGKADVNFYCTAG